jgi:hypothetical protein
VTGATPHQFECFERQVFGGKSERQRVLQSAQQMALGEVLAPPQETAPTKEFAGVERAQVAQVPQDVAGRQGRNLGEDGVGASGDHADEVFAIAVTSLEDDVRQAAILYSR